MDCLLPDVLAALAGDEPTDTRMLVPPPALRAPPARLAEGKGTNGADLAYHVDGEHFTVQWEDPSIEQARAEAILAQLESAWEVLVETDGWPAPASSDRYLLWVILDPTLAGSGFTTRYTSDEYPDGYPVSYVQPDYGQPDYPDYALSVGVHEFGHMLQYGLRSYETGRGDSWYWEATSEWVAEHAAPDLDTYALSTWFYASAPEDSYDSTTNGHQYGMLVLNAYLDERVFGFDGIRDVWMAEPGGTTPWDELLAAATGEEFDATIAAMAAHVGAGVLRESEIYYEPIRADTHRGEFDGEETLSLPERYGSQYVDFLDGAPGFYVEGEDARVSYFRDGEVLDGPPAEGPFTAVFTSLRRNGEVTYGATGEVAAEDSGTPAPEAEAPAACGCTSSSVPFGWGLVPAVAFVARRRSRN